MNKIVCYTCITRRYDSLKDPLAVSPEIDYVVFTDDEVSSKTWKKHSIPEELNYLSDVKRQRIVKICPHRYLPEYDISIWIDGSFQIVGDLKKFVEEYDLSKSPLYTRIHPSRNCIYAEAEACKALHKDLASTIDIQVERYRKEEYPMNIGMAETGILLRKHNDFKCKMLDNAWAQELLLNSCRDQLSFNYVAWKQRFVPGLLTNEFKAKKNDFFKLLDHNI